MNDIKDIRQNPDKYRKGLRDRGQDPTEIDRLLDADIEARMAKTHLQNLEGQGNVLTDIYALDMREMPPEVKERKKAELEKRLATLRAERYTLIAQEIAWYDKKIPAAEAKVADCGRRLAEWAAASEHAPTLEEICGEIKREDFFLQKGRGPGSVAPPRKSR